MTYVITDPCIGTLDKSCVEVVLKVEGKTANVVKLTFK